MIEREKEPKEVLREALAVLREGGWVQNAYVTEEGAHCLVGAIEKVVGVNYGWFQERQKALKLLGFDMGPDAVSWNDTPGRTQREVEALIEAVIA